MPKEREIQPIDGSLDSVAEALIASSHHQKPNKINGKDSKSSDLVITSPQAKLALFHVEKQVEREGIEMGVLENGIPYLTERGLAAMCGIDSAALNRLSSNWAEEKFKPRGKIISQLLEQSRYFEESLYLKSEINGVEINAYTEPVCLALLEYYAFLANEKREQAVNAFRKLARITFRMFIYQATGYSPDQKMLDSWRHFHDRVDMTLDAVPIGFFSVFREIASMIVPMIRAGILISDKVVPDISVGLAWSKFWKQNKLHERYGERTPYDHEYPLYYPQAKSNPQPAYSYPDSALGIFRQWLREHYISNKFPSYLVGQTKQGKIEMKIANKAIEAFSGKPIQYDKK